MVQRSKPNFDKPTAPVGRNEWPDNLSIPSGELVGVPRCRAAWTMVATIADLLQTLPSAVGKRGRESSGRSPTCLAGNKRRKSRSWSHTACAGQSLHGQPALQMQLCALATPRASVSDFEAGSNSTAHGNSLASSVTKQALKVLASISRSSHQEPTTMQLRDPTGPCSHQGCMPPGSSSRRSKGNASARTGGPRPRRHERLISAMMRHSTPSTGCPRRSASTLY